MHSTRLLKKSGDLLVTAVWEDEAGKLVMERLIDSLCELPTETPPVLNNPPKVDNVGRVGKVVWKSNTHDLREKRRPNDKLSALEFRPDPNPQGQSWKQLLQVTDEMAGGEKEAKFAVEKVA